MGADNQLYGGAISEFADSMAEEIENAYNTVLAENGRQKPPLSESPDDRRMLFIAISRGVINHLQKKQNAIAITIPAVNPAGQTVAAQIKKR